MKTVLAAFAKEGLYICKSDYGRYVVNNFDVNIGSSFSITGVCWNKSKRRYGRNICKRRQNKRAL